MSNAPLLSAPVIWMRGGTSKGGYFLANDMPIDKADRDSFLLKVMGSPDDRQIDGMGGADPLTSKVAIIKKSDRDGIDIDYLFLQIFVDQALVSDAQNCGNILAGVAPFAIERGLIAATDGQSKISIYMENTGQIAVATIETPNGIPTYSGDASIDGVPGTAAPISLEFRDTAGSSCGTLLPTGNAVDEIEGVRCTLIDNGMPCIVMKATDVGATGYESRQEMEDALEVRSVIEKIRRAAGERMNLGDVSDKSIPKIMLVASPKNGGAVTVRSFIPKRAHASVGVLAAITVATACLIENSPAAEVAAIPKGKCKTMSVEHPTGETTCIMNMDQFGNVESAAMLRTARKLMVGEVFA